MPRHLEAVVPEGGTEAWATGEFAVPLDHAWSLLSDLEAAERYVPGVVRSVLTTPRRPGDLRGAHTGPGSPATSSV